MIAALAYLSFSIWVGWQDVTRSIVLIGWGGTCITLSLSLVNYSLRFTRWQMYLYKLGYRVPTSSSLRIYLSGFALTTTPGKAGELIRSVMLKQRDVPYPASFAAFVSERLSDLTAIVLLILLGVSFYPQSWPMLMIGSIGIIVIMLLISSTLIHQSITCLFGDKYRRLNKLTNTIVDMLTESRRCHSTITLFIATFISLIAWGAEGLAFYWVLIWLNVEVPFTYAVFVYALSMLAGALSFLPGGLGGAEATMISLLLLYGIGMPEAVVATIFIRLATLWFAVIIGLFAMYASRKGETA